MIEFIDKALQGLVAPAANGKSEYDKAVSRIKGCDDGRDIMNFLTGAKLNVGALMVGMSSGVDSMYIPPDQLASESGLKKFTGGIAIVNIDNPMKEYDNDLSVSVLHELGHAKQYIEKPNWFWKAFRISVGALTDKEMSASKAKLEIEDDNIKRHEAKVASGLGHKSPRTKYT